MVFKFFSLTKFIPVLNVRHLQKGFWSGENREIGDTLSFVQKNEENWGVPKTGFDSLIESSWWAFKHESKSGITLK